MSARARAVAFAVAAVTCALLAAGAVKGYRDGVDRRLGGLRPVVVARAALAPGRPFDRAGAGKLLAIRRVPAAFAPPDALRSRAEAVGRRPALALAAGSYVTRAGLAERRPVEPRPAPRLRRRSPVELTISGGGALASGRGPVDVVVTSEPRAAAAGRTYIAAHHVPLIDLRRGSAAAVAGEGGWIATLALRRREALSLIRAESFARALRLLASPPRRAPHRPGNQ